MNILLTNDDGYAAPGIHAAQQALSEFGTVHVVAPSVEKSACSHTISLYGPIHVSRLEHPPIGFVHAVNGTPADCVRLAVAELILGPLDLVVSGINRGANAGVDTFYSGTVAGAREASILGFRSIALSHAVRREVETDWDSAVPVVGRIVKQLLSEELPGPGFWNVNLPPVLPDDPMNRIQRVPVARETVPLDFERSEHPDSGILQFRYGEYYWNREVSSPSDFSVVRDGGIAISAVPLLGRF